MVAEGRPTLFASPISRIGLVVILLVTAYALWVGNRLVRVAALANTANWMLIDALQPRLGRQVDARAFPWAQFVTDIVFAMVFVGLAVWSKRTWLALMAAFLVLGVANYASHLTEMRLWHRAFITASYLWGYSALACLGAGAMHARRRRPRSVAD